MPLPTNSIDTLLRRFEVDGVPSTPAFNPKKADLRAHINELWTLVEAIIVAGGKLYTSKAAMDADLVPGANTPAIVLGDATPANNGLYMKVGATTTGSWTRVGDVPGYSFIKAANAGVGTANAIVATTSIPIPSADGGALIALNITAANTAAATVAFNGGSALTIVPASGAALQAGDLKQGGVVHGYKSGSTFRLLNEFGPQFLAGDNAGAGSANAIVVTTTTPVPAADRGALITFVVTHVNTAATTVAFNGGTALAIKTNTGADVLPGTLTVGLLVAGYKVGSTFQLIWDINVAQYIAAAIDVMTTVLDPQFATKAAAELYDPDVAPSYIRTAGYTAAGTGGATYALVVSEPSHDGKIQIAEGSWYELASQRPDPLELGAVGDGVTDDTAALVATLGIGRPVTISARHLVDADSLVLAGDGQSITGALPAQAVAVYPGARIVTNATSGNLLEVTGHGCVLKDVHFEALSGKVDNVGIYAARPAGNADDLDLKVIGGSLNGFAIGAVIVGRSPDFKDTVFTGNNVCVDWLWAPGGTDGDVPFQGLPYGGRRARLIDCHQHGSGQLLRLSENANFRPLPYDGQSGQFTVGQVVTGATSGATGTIAGDDDQGTAGCLYLSGVTGTYVDGEALSDPITGAANANLPDGFEVWSRFQLDNYISDIGGGSIFAGSCAYGKSVNAFCEHLAGTPLSFVRRSRFNSDNDTLLGTQGEVATSPTFTLRAQGGLFESIFDGVYGNTKSHAFLLETGSRDVRLRGIVKNWGMDAGANRAALALSAGSYSNIDVDITVEPGAGSVHNIYAPSGTIINSRFYIKGGEALGEVIDPTGAWVDGGGNDFQYSGTKSTDNELDNGDFQVAQRGTSFTSATTPANSDGNFLFDRWRLLSDGNDVVDVSRTTSAVPTGSRTAIVLDIEAADKKAGLLQMLTNERSVDLIGWDLALQLKARIGGSNATLDLIRAGIVVWSGTADAPDADPISAWGAEGANPTLKTNWAFVGTPGSLAQLTTSYQTFRLRGKPTSGNNIGVLIWVDNADATVADLLYIGDVQLERGLCCTPYKQRRYFDDLARCQYHVGRIVAPENNVNVANGGITTTADGTFLISAFAKMWGSPSTTATISYSAMEILASGAVSAVTAASFDSQSDAGVSIILTGTGTPYTVGHHAMLRLDSGAYLEFAREI